MVVQASLAPLPSVALPSCRPADHDRGTGGLWQVLTPPCHPGGNAEALRGRLLEQVINTSSGLRSRGETHSGQVDSPPFNPTAQLRMYCALCVLSEYSVSAVSVILTIVSTY